MTTLRRVAALPWLFTQCQPLDTRSLAAEAKRRGFDLDTLLLRELYRRRLLIPVAAIRGRPVSEPIDVDQPEPWRPGSTRLEQFRRAQRTGHLQDLAASPYAERLRFMSATTPPSPGWWNGLLYSRYQLLVLPHLRAALCHRRRVTVNGRRVVRLPAPDQALVELAQRFHVIALAVTALEARYLPNLDREWVRLSNADVDEWESYRDTFDPVGVSNTLGYPATQARQDAEELLSLAHSIDPLGIEWGPLVRRAPRRAWEGLKGDALLAMDLRVAAEILLRFYEDLAAAAQAEPMVKPADRLWHPLHERLTVRTRTLDEDLARVGVSPHPRVVLAVEGASEAVYVPRIWAVLGFREAPELMRLLVLDGATRDVSKVAALAAAPLISRRQYTDTTYELLKPPTRLMIAVDPEGKYFAPHKVDATYDQILDEIRSVVAAQGATIADDDLKALVSIRTWASQCFEFAHFDDDELADGILQVNKTSGLTREQVSAEVAKVRKEGTKDINAVWSLWPRQVSKVDLAHALCPVLERKTAEALDNDAVPLPELAEVLVAAYRTALHRQSGSFVLSAKTGND